MARCEALSHSLKLLRLSVGLLFTSLLSAPSTHAQYPYGASAKSVPPVCLDARFLLPSPLLAEQGGSAGEALVVGSGGIAIDGICPLVQPKRMKGTRRGTRIKAKWPRCSGFDGVATLTGTIPPGCETFGGKLKVRKRKRGITGTRSRCGDARVDQGGGESCDPPGVAGCDSTCRLQSAGGGTTTTSSLVQALPTTTTVITGDPTTTSTVPQESPRSQDLIQEALWAGTIDYPTSLLYRAWALFSDSRLPPEYDGSGSTGEDLGLSIEAQLEWNALPAEFQDRLRPYLLRPTEPGSAFSQVEAASMSQPRFVSAASGGQRCGEWAVHNSTNFRVWYCPTAVPPADAAMAAEISLTAELLYGPMTTAMGAPLSDGQVGGDGRIDIYLAPVRLCVEREGVCRSIDPADSVAVAYPDFNDINPSPTASGFMLLSVERAKSPHIRTDLAHEFFHILQFRHNAHLYAKKELGVAVYQWFYEASATWAEWEFLPGLAGPRVHDRWFKPFLEFGHYTGLSNKFLRGHHAYIWPFFMQQEQGADAVYNAWKGATTARSFDDLNDVIDAQLPFASSFRDFLIRGLNLDLPGNPLGQRFAELASSEGSSFPDNVAPAEVRHVNQGVVSTSEPVEYRIFSLPPLSGHYDRFSVPESIRFIRLDFAAVAPTERRDVAVIADVAGTWKVFDTNEEGRVEFCRDQGDQDVREFYLIVGNHSKEYGEQLGGQYTVQGMLTCPYPRRWSGQISQTIDYTVENVGHSHTDVTLSVAFQLVDALSDIPKGTFIYRLESATGSVRTNGTYGDCSRTGGPTPFQISGLDPPLGFMTVQVDPFDVDDALWGVGVLNPTAVVVNEQHECPDRKFTQDNYITINIGSSPDARFARLGWAINDTYAVGPISESFGLTGGDFADP